MKLYYTTTAGENQVVTDPRLSLGGYQSATLVGNNVFDNLFSEISLHTLSRVETLDQPEYIGLILRNETEEDVENLWIWFEYPEDCYCELLIAAVDLNSSGAMENISSRHSQPLYATFYEADGVENAVPLGTILREEMVGLWICRRLKTNILDTLTDNSLLYTDSGATLKTAVMPNKSDSIRICFVWGAEYYNGIPLGGDLI